MSNMIYDAKNDWLLGVAVITQHRKCVIWLRVLAWYSVDWSLFLDFESLELLGHKIGVAYLEGNTKRGAEPGSREEIY
jgi:hypothetical protein